MRVSTDFRKPQQRRPVAPTPSEAVVATLWLVFYVLAITVAGSSLIVSRAIELAEH